MTDRAEVLALLDELIIAVDDRLDIATKAEGYKPLRKRYNIELFGAFNGYLTMDNSLVKARNDAKKLIVEYFYSAFVRGYEEAGASEDELTSDSDDLAWLNDRTEAEIGYIGTAFAALKEAKKQEGITRDELITLAHERADGYTDSLDMIYAEGKMRGSKNIMLTMVGDDGNESCADCQERKGKRYSAKKWLAIGYPPSRDFECHGYNCRHYLVTDDGKRYTP